MFADEIKVLLLNQGNSSGFGVSFRFISVCLSKIFVEIDLVLEFRFVSFRFSFSDCCGN